MRERNRDKELCRMGILHLRVKIEMAYSFLELLFQILYPEKTQISEITMCRIIFGLFVEIHSFDAFDSCFAKS